MAGVWPSSVPERMLCCSISCVWSSSFGWLAWNGDAAGRAAPSRSAGSSGSDNLGLNLSCVFKREADPKTCCQHSRSSSSGLAWLMPAMATTVAGFISSTIGEDEVASARSAEPHDSHLPSAQAGRPLIQYVQTAPAVFDHAMKPSPLRG